MGQREVWNLVNANPRSHIVVDALFAVMQIDGGKPIAVGEGVLETLAAEAQGGCSPPDDQAIYCLTKLDKSTALPYLWDVVKNKSHPGSSQKALDAIIALDDRIAEIKAELKEKLERKLEQGYLIDFSLLMLDAVTLRNKGYDFEIEYAPERSHVVERIGSATVTSVSLDNYGTGILGGATYYLDKGGSFWDIDAHYSVGDVVEGVTITETIVDSRENVSLGRGKKLVP